MKKNKVLIFVLISILIVAAVVGIYMFNEYNKNQSEIMKMYESGVVVDGILAKGDKEFYQDEFGIYVSLGVAQELIDPNIKLSSSGERFFIPYKSVKAVTDSESINKYFKSTIEKVNFLVDKKENEVYLNLDLLCKIYSMEYKLNENTNVLNILTQRIEMKSAIAQGSTNVMTEKGNLGLKAFKTKVSEKLTIIKETDEEFYVIGDLGYAGYISKNEVIAGSAIKIDYTLMRIKEKREKLPENLVGSWDQVHKKADNNEFILDGEKSGLDVIYPTWFKMNVDGIVLNLADLNYVKAAKERGYQVHPLYDNNFKPDWTHEMLVNPKFVDTSIAQIMFYSLLYDTDGVNIDFENMHLKDKNRFTDYVRKMCMKLNNIGLYSSIDVTVPWGSDMWSKVYDRHEIGKCVDYVMLMAYDEHWASSPKAGSVASSDWVEKGITEMLKLVPREKLILGVPFYTRVWTEDKTSGKMKVSSKTLTYEHINNYLDERSLKTTYNRETKQNFVSFSESAKVTKKIWLEDETSVKMRLDIANKHDLPGVASWSYDFATDDLWDLINSYYK